LKKKLVIRTGYCGCGCGKKTKVYKNTNYSRGIVKGKLAKFLVGHNLKHWIKTVNGGHPSTYTGGRHNSMGYIKVIKKDHPRANLGLYVFEHILVAEKVLGKYLPEKASIHHVNEDKTDNRNENLVICEDESYHQYLHVRMRMLKACGHADWRRCKFCRVYDKPENIVVVKQNGSFHHRDCYNKYQKEYRKVRMEKQLNQKKNLLF
jgi:hypothetical protein